MTIPCSQEDKLREIHKDVKDLKRDFENFRLLASTDIVKLQVKSKHAAKNWGAISGFISSIIVGIIMIFIKTKS